MEGRGNRSEPKEIVKKKKKKKNREDLGEWWEVQRFDGEREREMR